jgi:hypothetical protein
MSRSAINTTFVVRRIDNVAVELQVAILVALIGLIGVVVVGIMEARSVNATLKQSGAIEERRWEREDQRRHEDARREAYPVFLAVADEVVLGLSAALRGEASQSPIGPHARERLRGALAVIEFVGSPETIDRAQLLFRAVQRLWVGVDGIVAMAQLESEEAAAGDEVLDDTEATNLKVEETEADESEAGDVLGEGDTTPTEEVDWDGDDRSSMRDFMAFVDNLPYPLGGDVHPRDMYFGNPLLQISMARSELRVRRHDYLNAARTDLGMGTLDYPADGTWSGMPPDEGVDEADGVESQEEPAGEQSGEGAARTNGNP